MAAFRAGLLAAMARSASRVPIAGPRGRVGWLLPYSSVRAAHDLPPHLMPGPYPKTAEERAAAAKKYNLPLEDYKPYPDDGMGYGDYPMLPEKSQEERDGWYTWDHSDFRTNWGETLHWDFDKYLRHRLDTTPTRIPYISMLKTYVGLLSIIALLLYIGQIFPMYTPVAPKQYPYNNLYLEYGGDPSKAPPEVKNYEFK